MYLLIGVIQQQGFNLFDTHIFLENNILINQIQKSGIAIQIIVPHYNPMQNQKQNKVVNLNIPALHTYMVKQDDYTSTDEMKVSLLSGEAQIMGIQLKKHYPLKFKMPCILLIFTWEGCELKVEWPEDKTTHSSDQWCDITLNNHLSESPMIKYLSLHYDLTIARKLAHQQVKRGPRLAIVGGQNVGTNFVSRLMLNYTGKLNMRPIFVDLDLDNSIFLDGAVGAAAYQYRVTTSDDLFQKCDKICYIYGNRKIRTSSFMKMARQLVKYTNIRLDNEMQNLKWKGCSNEISTFAAGIILQCPKISDEKKYLKEMLAQLLTAFEITHVVIIDNPDISSFLSRNCPNIQRFNTSKLQGIDTLLKIQKKNKINRYFGSDPTQFITVKIELVVLFQLIEGEHKSAYVRRIDIKTELVNKTAISILSAKLITQQDPEETAKRISESPVLYGCRIYKISQEDVTFEVPPIQNFWEQCKGKLWVSMIAEKINS